MLKCFGAEDFDLINLTNQEAIKFRQTQSKTSFEIVVAHVDFKIMHEFLPVDVKRPLVSLVGNSIPNL